MTTQRDFLERAPGVVGSSNDELLRLMSQQNDYLQDIAIYLRRLTADVLAVPVVKGTSQLSNAITDTNVHEVTFQVGGKPVEIFDLWAFSSYAHNVTLSILSFANDNDGIVFSTGDVLNFGTPIESVWIKASALTGGTCSINGPAGIDGGGFFLWPFTIPDYVRVRNAIRS